MNTSEAAPVYYSELRLSNVKAFLPGVVLDLRLDGGPAPWTLVLGENGLGKTTLLQCLALMRPILNVEQSGRTDARDPDRVEPAIPAYEDALLVEIARVGEGLQVGIEAEFSIGRELRPAERPKGRGKHVATKAAYRVEKQDLTQFDFSKTKRKPFLPPLVVGYSAARHPPYRRSDVVSDQEDPTASLFNAEIELADAVQILEDLDHIALREDRNRNGKSGSTAESRAAVLYREIRQALACILPEVECPERIHVYGPALPGFAEEKTGVWIETYSGEVPLHSLSIGYQTMFAWTVDLAWRMAEYHKDSVDPLREPAIVLIDELDLHLHPKWQRRVRRDLSGVFPKVQFIVTTHSPVLAQTYLDTNIAVVTREGDHAIIDNDPQTVRSWRLDQVSVGLLHDADPYAPEIVEAFETRRTLLGKETLDPDDRERLEAANALVAAIPSDLAREDDEAAKLIREAAALLTTRAP
ncbi:AAA family ATPase [Sphingobium sp. Sx8-8]|uniref:AAA family ATPase n=1 Tax=Sphingobium sp. Sx8-8 TaxID=2933617 RepID=UPI001F56A8FC|nr:AAA family ATPase [Sphingobium sp. Sx8-8]